MTYLPFVYLILLSPEEYYNNKVQWTNGYQPIPQAYAAKKFDVHDKIHQPQIYFPYFYLTPSIGGHVLPAPDPPDEVKRGKEDGEKKDEAGENEMMMEEESGEMTTIRNNGDDLGEDKGVTWRHRENIGFTGYAAFVSKCGDGYVTDENGNCAKEIILGKKELSLDRKKRADTRNSSKDRMIFKLSKKISVRDKRSANEEEKRKKILPRISSFKCKDSYEVDENGQCVKKTSLRKSSKSYERELTKLGLSKKRHGKKSKLKGVKLRKERFAEEKKLSYADIVKYGRRGPPTPKPIDPKSGNLQNSTSKSPSASTTTTKPPTAPSVAPLSKPGVIKPQPSTPNKASKTEASKPATVDPFKPKSSTKAASGDPSLMLINSEKNPASVKSSTSKSQSDSSRRSTTPDPFLFLLSSYCKDGYQKDENDNCIKVVEKKGEIKRPNLERKKRESDFNSQLFRRLYNEAERNRQGRNSDYATGTTPSTFLRRVKKIENDTRKTDPGYSPIASSKSSQETSDKIPSDEKNAASDGFGYISKECSKLVPGLVSDGAGGCTKAVKVKEKILQLERKKRQAQTAFINFIDPSNRLRKNNFTITITIKGLNKQRNFANEAHDLPIDGGDKAVADNGFGVTSSKCDNLVPGLVPDGVGGCTKAITNIRKRNKFSFIVRNVENSQPVIDLEYENPEPELVSINPGDDDDPDADII